MLSFLQAQRDCVNAAYKVVNDLEKLSIVDLHKKFYFPYLEGTKVPSQLVIRSEKEALATFRTMKGNKHKKTIPVKTGLSTRLDKRIYTFKGSFVRLTTLENRINAKIEMYPRLAEVFDRLNPCDPLIYERNGEIWINLAFKETLPKAKSTLILGIDLGVRRLAATSEGNLFIDRKFNGKIRKLRFQKRKLQSKGTKSARKKSRKVGKREARMKKNMLHSLSNQILKTSADVLVMEDLSKIKFKKKKRNQTKQTSLFALRQMLTYKAPLVGKRVETVSPYYTSQTDCLSGNREGERKGCRFYCKDGKTVLDSDWNAACNIAFKFAKSAIGNQAKLPVSWKAPLDGQAVVKRPNACKSTAQAASLASP